MIHRMSFGTLLTVILTLAIFAQVYLFIHVRRAIRSSRQPDRVKSRSIRLVGVVICVLFGANMYLTFKPVPWVDPPSGAQLFLLYPPAIWGLGSILSAFLLLFMQVAGVVGKMILSILRTLAGRAVSSPVNQARRRFLQAGVGGLAAAPFLLSGYGAVCSAETYEVTELTLPFGSRLRVVQLTDIHAGIYMNSMEMRRYVDRIIALKPDLFVLTGDFISNSMAFLPGCLEEMARVQARYGTFATLGNHEHWYGEASIIRTVFRNYEIPLLLNSHQVIQSGSGSFAVAGIDDLWAGFPDLEAALHGLNSAIPTLLLSHRPEIFPQAASRGIPLTLAGHYHGGQVKLSLPGGDISMAHFRTPYPEGLYRLDASCLYVSRGIGTTFIPVRLNARPEITLFHLT